MLDGGQLPLKAQGDLAAARPLYERALAIYEKALGPEHPDTAGSLNNLALLLKRKLPQNFGMKRRISESCQPVTSNLSPRILRCYWQEKHVAFQEAIALRVMAKNRTRIS